MKKAKRNCIYLNLVIEFKNFGHVDNGINDDGIITQKFYYCFFKLSSGRIMQVMEVENFDDN